MGSARCLRRAIMETLHPHRRRAIGAVLDLRSPGAGSARHLAGAEIAFRRSGTAELAICQSPPIANGDCPAAQRWTRTALRSGDRFRQIEQVDRVLQGLDLWKAGRIRAALRHRPVKRVAEARRLTAQLLQIDVANALAK